jgi:hypothetical protein
LHIDDSSSRECAHNANAGAVKIVNTAKNISGVQAANGFRQALESEAQNISTASTPYQDLDSTSQYPKTQSQSIVLGFFLPTRHFSYTASTRVVVDVFCQLVSFIHDHQAWVQYATRSMPTDYYARDPVGDSSPIFSSALIWVQRHFVISKGAGLGTKTSTETCS